MFCENCGAQVIDGVNNCPNCGASVISSNFSAYNSNPSNPEVKTTGLLVWSIIEICCINTITGIIAIILYFVQLKPAIERGDMVGVAKAKRNMKIALWVGLGLFLVIMLFFGVAVITAVMLPMVNSTRNTTYEFNDANNRINSLVEELESNSSYNSDYYNY